MHGRGGFLTQDTGSKRPEIMLATGGKEAFWWKGELKTNKDIGKGSGNQAATQPYAPMDTASPQGGR